VTRKPSYREYDVSVDPLAGRTTTVSRPLTDLRDALLGEHAWWQSVE